jgi:hypothetical protein
MSQSKEEFVDVVVSIRNMLSTDECAECSCPNIRCEWHGDCYNCIRIYRYFGRHFPRCLQFVLDKKISKITDAAKAEGQKKPLTPDGYFDYLNSTAPRQSAK